MSTTPPPTSQPPQSPQPGQAAVSIPDLQEALVGVEQIALAGSAPFVHSDKGKTQVATIASEVNLGIAALPLLAQLFSAMSGLFHHAHKVATTTPPPVTPPTQ